MSINPFSFSNICLLLITAGLTGYLIFLWHFVTQKTRDVETQSFKKPVQRFAVFYTVYFIAISLLAAVGFFKVITMPPRFLLIFLPLLFIVIILSKARLDGPLRFLQILPPFYLITVHVYRLFIELVFIRYANEGVIPPELSLHGRNYDLWIGVLAIPVGLLFLTRHKLAAKAGIIFNVAGLLSLLNIFTIVVPSMPSPFRVYRTLYLPTYFPGILIVFLASVAIFIHIISFRQLLAQRRTATVPKGVENAADQTVLLQ